MLAIVNRDAKGMVSLANGILAKHQGTSSVEEFLDGGEIPTHIQGHAVLAILAKQHRKGWFDICSVREMAEVKGVNFSAKEEAFLSSLHCVHWSDMAKDLKDYLNAIIIKHFEHEILALDS